MNNFYFFRNSWQEFIYILLVYHFSINSITRTVLSSQQQKWVFISFRLFAFLCAINLEIAKTRNINFYTQFSRVLVGAKICSLAKHLHLFICIIIFVFYKTSIPTILL